MIKMAPQISEKRIISLVDGLPKKKISIYKDQFQVHFRPKIQT